MSFTQRIAEQIMNDAQSGSAAWDELNGPSAKLQPVSHDTFRIIIPQEYDENDMATAASCLITVELAKPHRGS